MKQKIFLGITALCFLIALLGVRCGFSVPKEEEKEVTKLTYELKSKFDHEAYGWPARKKETKANPTYFTKLIDSIEVSYSYKFLPEKPVTSVKEQVQISAIVESPGLWQKEVILIPQTTKEGDFTLRFPLDMGPLLKLGGIIAGEVGAGAPTQEITLKASVHTVAQTGAGVLESDFVQTNKVMLKGTLLEWDRNLAQSRKGYWMGLFYQQQGSFGYAIKVRPSILSEATLKQEELALLVSPPPTPEEKPEEPKPNPTYFAKLIDSIEVSYSYRLLPEKPVTSVKEQVQISAILESPGAWQKEVILVPQANKEGAFTVTFPLDMETLLQLGGAISRELGTASPAPEITLKASVHTVAQTAAGTLEEDFVQTNKVMLKGALLEWDRNLAQSQEGSWKGLNYQHQGDFSYIIRLQQSILSGPPLKEEELAPLISPPPPPEQRSEEKKPNPVYFTKIIDSIEVAYSYRLLSEKPVTSVREQVEISALVGTTGLWQKEITLVSQASKDGAFTIRFPLDTAPLMELAKKIAEELGAAAPAPEVTLKASVHTVAITGAGVLEEDFVQTNKVMLRGATLEWDRNLVQVQEGYWKGLSYQHQGKFGYVIGLKPNTLIPGPITVDPELPSLKPPESSKPKPAVTIGPVTAEPPPPPPPPAPPVKLITMRPEVATAEPSIQLGKGKTYTSDTLDRLEMTFSNKLESEQQLGEVTGEVEITAAFSKTGEKGKPLVVVPKSKKKGDLAVTFPLDMGLFYDMARAIEGENKTLAGSYDVVVTANVHTVAQTDFKPVEEAFSQSLTLKLEADKLQWPEEASQTKPGAIKEKETVANPNAGLSRTGSLGALGMTSVLLFYGVWGYMEARRKRISRVEAEAIQARNKYHDLLVDVEKLPPAAEGETVVQVGSLAELIKAAETLFKPVLHQTEPERHTYCIIDGTTRYQYVSQEELPPPSPPPESSTDTPPQPS